MKTSKQCQLAVCVGIALAATATSQAATIAAGISIGFDFGPDAPTNNFNQVNTLSVPAGSVIDTDGNDVDDVSFTITAIAFNNGDPSVPSTYGVTAPAFYDDSNTTDWYGNFSDPGAVTITLAGLDDSLTYDLNIYSGMNLTQDIIVDYTVGATTLTASANHGTSTFSPFVDFSNLSSSGGELIVTMTPGAGSFSQLNTISALHLTAVPEPSSAALLGLGGLSLLVLRKRSNA